MRRSLIIAGAAIAFVTSGACGFLPPYEKLATTIPPWVHGSGHIYGSEREAVRACAETGRYAVGFNTGKELGWVCRNDVSPRTAPPADKPQGSN